MQSIKPIYVLILVIVFAAGGFYGGVLYQKSQSPSMAQTMNDSQGGKSGPQIVNDDGSGDFKMKGGQGPMQKMEPVSGQIISQDSNSITVKLEDGSSKIINFTDQTKINKTTEVAVSDLKTGEQITALGSTNTDGSVTAENISIGGGMMRIQRQPK